MHSKLPGSKIDAQTKSDWMPSQTKASEDHSLQLGRASWSKRDSQETSISTSHSTLKSTLKSKDSLCQKTDASASPSKPPIHNVMNELEKLSRSFASSYQTLESHVEQLNGKLEDATSEKLDAVRENEKLLAEKSALASRLQSLLALLPSGIVVLDGQGFICECNAVAIDLLGRPLLGKKWLEVIQRSFAPRADDGHQVSLKDGRKIHIETRALDSEPGQLIVLTDLTKTRELQARLSQQQRLQSMGKMVASLAHQIRTPLSAALLYASHLSNEQISMDVRREFSVQLTERLHYMERQINDMLAFVRGERKQKQWFEAVELFDQIRQQTKNLQPPVKCVFESSVTSALQMYGDIDGLRGALMNLIENAIAATAEMDRRIADIRVIFSVSDKLTIKISDNGCGIAESEVTSIFDAFYTNKSNGNGLGLAIVKNMVAYHGGTIQVKSSPGQGSCFSINFPLISRVENAEKIRKGESE